MGEPLDIDPGKPEPESPLPRGNAGFGVLSCLAFGVNLLCLATSCVLMAVALTLVETEGEGFLDGLRSFNEQLSYAIFASILVTVGMLVSGVGFLLGLFALLLPGRRWSWAVKGVVLNAFGFLPYLLLLVWSSFVGG